MGKFSRIEKLIGSEVKKFDPPSELGEGPKWRVKSHSNKHHGKKSFKKKHHHRSKSNQKKNPNK